MNDPVYSVPRNTHRLFLTYSLIPGEIPEPPVQNRDLLASFLDVGVWLRVANAAGQLAVLRSPSSSPVQRFSALAGFYQQAGLQTEDALSNLIAWSAWAKDREQSLADMLDRISLRMSRPRGATPEKYFETVRDKLISSSKRVEISVADYAASLLAIPAIALPEHFGIPWKRHPSVKDVGPMQRPMWDTLPAQIKSAFTLLLGRNGEHLSSCYNKIKHGPQLLIAESLHSAAARGIPDAELRRVDPLLAKPTLRLLFRGARTQETADELTDSQRAAPFLYQDADNARRWLLQSLFPTASILSLMGTWIFNFHFRESPRAFGVSDQFLISLLAEQRDHVARAPFPSSGVQIQK